MKYFIKTYKKIKNTKKQIQLKHLSQIPKIYIPNLYKITYQNINNNIKSIKPINKNIPTIIQKQTYKNNTLSTSTIITKKTT